MMKPEVLLYTTSWCPFCRRAKMLLQQKGVEWNELDIEADPTHRQAMIDTSRRTSVPQIFINGAHVGGCDELFELESKGELDKFLARRSPAN